jgi:branched-chain amino acid transport system permease protein
MSPAVAATLSLVGLFLALAFILPEWVLFVLTLALAKGLVVLGVVLLMYVGLVSFGQGLLFAVSAYTVGFAMKLWGIREAVVALGLGTAASLVVAALAGLLLARYREIFFAMLSLAFSMILYGILIKAYWITGGSDGLSIAPATVLGFAPAGEKLRVLLYALTVAVAAAAVYAAHRYSLSPLGYAARAVRDNEVRVEYLGVSVARAVYVTYLLAGGLGGLGGVLVALNVGHIDPLLAYWTTSGEFVFIALLGGTRSVLAPLGGAIVYEFIRTYAFKYSPYTWQMTLGVIMLALILFMPGGLWTIYAVLEERGRRWGLFWKRTG